MIYVFTPEGTDASVAEAFAAVGAAGSTKTCSSLDFLKIKDELLQGDTAVFPDVVSFGRRYEDVLEGIKFLSVRGVALLFIKEQIMIDPKSPSPVYLTADTALRIYKSLLSHRNKTIQENLLKAGRHRGAPARIRKKLESIQAVRLEAEGKDLDKIAARAGCSRSTVYRYLKKQKAKAV